MNEEFLPPSEQDDVQQNNVPKSWLGLTLSALLLAGWFCFLLYVAWVTSTG